MSGIGGIVNFTKDTRQYSSTYGDMLKKLKRRGADHNGKYCTEKVSLLQTSFITAEYEKNKTPAKATSGDCEIVIVYDGRLYNTDDILDNLCLPANSRKEITEAEIILYSYIYWGENCLDKFNGTYAFAIWDGKKQQLFMARDKIGIKPFFYSVVDDEFVFASEIKALLCHKPVTPEVDKDGIMQLMLLGPGRESGTCAFRNINELCPGEFAIFSKNDGLVKVKYWDCHSKKHPHNFDQTLENVRCLVKDSIKRQSNSPAPMGVFLSGGLDSSAIAALSGVKNTFSVDYAENEKYFTPGKFQPDSDTKYISQMVDFLGLNHTYITIETDELVDALFEAVEARDLPGMADVDSSLLLFCRKVKEQAKVVLSGESADEIFGGYPWYRDDNLLYKRGFPWSQSTEYRSGFLHKDLLDGLDAFDYVNSKYEKGISTSRLLESDSPQDKRIRQMFKLNLGWFMQTLVDRKDRMCMYNGIEARVPFCDYRIVEYMYNVPWEFNNYKNREKGLLRQALTGVLPDEVLWRKKSPYPKTHHPDYLKKVSDILHDIIADPNAPIHNITDKSALEKLLATGGNGVNWYGQLMALPQTIAYFIQMNEWMSKYKISLI